MSNLSSVARQAAGNDCELREGPSNFEPVSFRPVSNDVAPNRQSSSATADMSDLARGNFEHVAAPSIQIREVLVSNAGLLVELERWVAKEATDNGQVLQEFSLSQQAIFDRPDPRDVKFLLGCDSPSATLRISPAVAESKFEYGEGGGPLSKRARSGFSSDRSARG